MKPSVGWRVWAFRGKLVPMAITSQQVTFNPEGQLTYGLTGFDGVWTISGYALVTNGFLWLEADIWIPCPPCEPVVWVDAD